MGELAFELDMTAAFVRAWERAGRQAKREAEQRAKKTREDVAGYNHPNRNYGRGREKHNRLVLARHHADRLRRQEQLADRDLISKIA